jgi:hypothetical protein
MLRPLALGLLVANALLLAGHFGAFDKLTGAAAPAQREPERLQRQVHPELIGILSPQAASAALGAAAASAAASAALAAAAAASADAPACLEAGPFNAVDADATERTLRDAGLPAGSWAAHKTEDGGAFMVYMGRYADRETLQRKLEELKRRRLEAEDLRNTPELQPGLSLGRFASKAEADAALAGMVQRGVRTARVITLRQAQSQTLIQVPAADATLRARLAGLKLPTGPGFAACNAAPAEPAASAALAAAAAPSAALAASGAVPASAASATAASHPAAATAASRPAAASAASRPAAASAASRPAAATAASHPAAATAASHPATATAASRPAAASAASRPAEASAASRPAEASAASRPAEASAATRPAAASAASRPAAASAANHLAAATAANRPAAAGAASHPAAASAAGQASDAVTAKPSASGPRPAVPASDSRR